MYIMRNKERFPVTKVEKDSSGAVTMDVGCERVVVTADVVKAMNAAEQTKDKYPTGWYRLTLNELVELRDKGYITRKRLDCSRYFYFGMDNPELTSSNQAYPGCVFPCNHDGTEGDCYDLWTSALIWLTSDQIRIEQ